MITSQRHSEKHALRFEVKVWGVVEFVTAVAVCSEDHQDVCSERNSIFTKVLGDLSYVWSVLCNVVLHIAGKIL